MDAYIEKSLHILELPAVLSKLADFAVTPTAKENAVKLMPLQNPREIRRLLDEVSEACRLIIKKGNPSFYGVKDIRGAVARSERGGILTARELLDIATLLRVSRGLRDYGELRRNRENPGVNRENPGVNGENPGVNGENPGVNRENPGVNRENPGVNRESSGVNRENPGVNRENPGVNQENLGKNRENWDQKTANLNEKWQNLQRENPYGKTGNADEKGQILQRENRESPYGNLSTSGQNSLLAGEEESVLEGYFWGVFCDAGFEKSIFDAIISEEEIADNASSTLYTIRRKIKNAQARVKDVLNRILATHGGKILQETLITQRFGRYVVPVKAEHKSELPGMVHDVSASGATVFIEPMAVIEANNEISMLQGEEAREIERILAAFSEQVYQRSASLVDSYNAITALDLIFAKAKLAFDMDACRPAINERGVFVLRRARHPLLPKETAVPIDITLGEGYDTLIITGPNTGGKTVSLKTLGLLTLMANCGLHIPAGDGCSLPVVDVFADIGDEQSIEQSLSTFSSHMKNIIEILKSADEKSLVLFDELGAGTDPVEGAALAIAIIERAAAKGARIAATTHYAELKVYALNTGGVENASCEFDVETLRPTYRLLTGVPGRSNAFAISRRLGLEDEVIEHARGLIGEEAGRFEDVIDRLEKNRREAEAERLKAEVLRREVEALNKKAREREKRYEEEKQKAAARARAEAEEIVRKARKEADDILEELRALRKKAMENAQASLDFNKIGAETGRKFNALESAVAPSLAAEEADSPPSRPIAAGDRVRILRLGSDATVITPPDKDGNMQVLAGIIKMTVKVSEVRLLEDAKKPEVREGVTITRAQVGSAAAANRLDLRGMAADEALLELERFIDLAARQHLPAVTIVHGKGTGKLRDEVRKALKKNKLVSAFRPGVYGEGEDGVTIVEF